MWDSAAQFCTVLFVRQRRLSAGNNSHLDEVFATLVSTERLYESDVIKSTRTEARSRPTPSFKGCNLDARRCPFVHRFASRREMESKRAIFDSISSFFFSCDIGRFSGFDTVGILACVSKGCFARNLFLGNLFFV